METTDPTNFQVFQEDFDKTFESVYDFIMNLRYNDGKERENMLNAVLAKDNDIVAYDSYGSEDSELERVYQFPDYGGIYVMFRGTRCSYQGEDWNDDFKEVKPTEKVIINFE